METRLNRPVSLPRTPASPPSLRHVSNEQPRGLDVDSLPFPPPLSSSSPVIICPATSAVETTLLLHPFSYPVNQEPSSLGLGGARLLINNLRLNLNPLHVYGSRQDSRFKPCV